MKYSKRTGTSFDDEKARRKEGTKLDFRCPICRSTTGQASFFNLLAQSSTDVPVLLLNQPILKIWDETICLALVVKIARRLLNKTWLRGD